MSAPRSTRISITSFRPRNAAPWIAVKSASFTALMSAPASSSTVTAASALVERRPRCRSGLKVAPSNPRGDHQRRRAVDGRQAAGWRRASQRCSSDVGHAVRGRCHRPCPLRRTSRRRWRHRGDQERRRPAQIAGAARERLECALLRESDIAHGHRDVGDACVRVGAFARAAP